VFWEVDPWLVGSLAGEAHKPERSSELDRWFQGPHETATDAAGAYIFDGVEGRRELIGARLLWATHSSRGVSLIRELPEVDATIDLELLGSGRIEGVVDGVRGGVPLVFARHADEPEGVRRQIVTRSTEVRYAGEFCFEDLPPGNYVLSLRVPSRIHTSAVEVTVHDDHTVSAKLEMVTSGVSLTVVVPAGRGMSLVLVSADSSTPEPEPSLPRMVVHETRFTMTGNPSTPSRGREMVKFDYLEPGTYRASIDGQTWTPIVVVTMPSEQRVEVGLPE